MLLLACRTRIILRISGEQRQKGGEREARVACEGRTAKKLTPVARDSRFALVSLSPLFAENAQIFMPVLQAMFLSANRLQVFTSYLGKLIFHKPVKILLLCES